MIPFTTAPAAYEGPDDRGEFEHAPDCALNDAHDYAVWTFQCAARDLMENHGYTTDELAGLVVEALPVAEEVDENAPKTVAPF